MSPVNPYLDVKGPNGEPWPPQDTVRPWDSLNDEEKRLFCRMAEVFAGFLSYTDAQIGRILDYLEESGQLDNTIIVVISDNGASGEGGPNGSVNEVKFFNGYIDTVEESMRFYDHLGGPETYNHYPIGWAMAFNTPYKLFKRYASHEGGIADTAIISWPNGIAAHGEVRDNYVNVCDITPTVYDLLGVTPPAEVGGIAQKPLDGVSFKAALDDPAADTGKDTQFYTMLGTRGIWHKGWFANTVHAATPAGLVALRQGPLGALPHRVRPQPVPRPGRRAARRSSRSSRSCGSTRPAKYNGLPLADLNILETMTRWRPVPGRRPQELHLLPGHRRGRHRRRGRTRAASRSRCSPRSPSTPPAPRACSSSRAPAHGGHVLFIQDGRLHYVYNFMGEEEQKVSSPGAVPLGSTSSASRYDAHRHRRGQPHAARRRLAVRRRRRRGARCRACKTHPGTFGLAGGDDQRRAQHRLGGVEQLQGSVRLHRRHHRPGRRRPLGRAVCGRGTRTRTGFLEGLMMER